MNRTEIEAMSNDELIVAYYELWYRNAEEELKVSVLQRQLADEQRKIELALLANNELRSQLRATLDSAR